MPTTDRPTSEPKPNLWPAFALAGVALALWRAAGPKPLPVPQAQGRGPLPRSSSPPTDESTAGAPPAPSGDAARGRHADKPSDIPAQGWWDILKRVYSEINDDRVLAVAAGVTFYALLAVFPAIAAFVSLYGLFSDASTISKQLDSLSSVLPGGALQIIGDQVKSITSKPGTSLGFATVFGLLVSLWSANAGMKALFDALNVVYEEKEKRSFVWLNVISLSFTLGAIVFLILAMSAVVVVPVILNFFGLGSIGAQLIALCRWPVLLVVVAFVLAVLYRYGPSRPKAKWRWITWGSALAAVLWMIASVGFSFYVGHFGSYNATYGSLGAAIGFMTWIWISTIVILLGGEVSAEMEHQTARDTTAGHEKPMGSRGASMADEVA